MNNNEKARKLAIKYTQDINDKGIEVYDVRSEAALQEMAEWKDEQAAAAYCKCCDTRECEDYESDTCNWLEKFKKVLRGGRK